MQDTMEPEVDVPPSETVQQRRTAAGFVDPRWYGIYVLIGFVVLFSLLMPDTFFTTTNFKGILSTQSVAAILAIALVVPLVAGYFDLSLASVLTLSMVVTAGAFTELDAPIVLAVAMGLASGLLVGLVNGVAVAVFGINSLVVTLATGSIAQGLAYWWTNGQIFSQGIPQSFQKIGQGSIEGIPSSGIYLLVIAVVVWWMLERTPAGRYLHAVGDNRDAASLAGLPTGRLTIVSFVLAGTLAAVAGVVEAAKLGAGNPTIGPSFLLPAFAAAFLGATIYRVGQYNVVGTVVAVFVVAVGIAGIEQLGVPFYIEPIFTGVVLLVAVAIVTMRGRALRGA